MFSLVGNLVLSCGTSRSPPPTQQEFPAVRCIPSQNLLLGNGWLSTPLGTTVERWSCFYWLTSPSASGSTLCSCKTRSGSNPFFLRQVAGRTACIVATSNIIKDTLHPCMHMISLNQQLTPAAAEGMRAWPPLNCSMLEIMQPCSSTGDVHSGMQVTIWGAAVLRWGTSRASVVAKTYYLFFFFFGLKPMFNVEKWHTL